jgi:hypothetical protein
MILSPSESFTAVSPTTATQTELLFVNFVRNLTLVILGDNTRVMLV